jgi:hypothetical protein
VRDVLRPSPASSAPSTDADSWAVRRDDGIWLLDGLIPTPELKDRLDLKELPERTAGRYNTLAGMIMLLLGRLPGDGRFGRVGGWRFEVVDLDGKRVDKVLASVLPRSAAGEPSTARHEQEHVLPVPPLGAARSGAAWLHSVSALTDFSITRDLHAVFITATEFPQAGPRLPLLFVATGQRGCRGAPLMSTVALLGSSRARTCSSKASAGPAATSRPAIRRYPVRQRERPGATGVKVLVDDTGRAFPRASGEPLFVADGRPAPALSRAIDFIERFELEAERTRTFCERVVALDVLKQMKAEATLPGRADGVRRRLPRHRRGPAACLARCDRPRAAPDRHARADAGASALAGQHPPPRQPARRRAFAPQPADAAA